MFCKHSKVRGQKLQYMNVNSFYVSKVLIQKINPNNQHVYNKAMVYTRHMYKTNDDIHVCCANTIDSKHGFCL